jgi:nucleotide sugar dehydrogenase
LTLQADRPRRAHSRVVDETPAGRLQVIDLPAETAADLAAMVPVEAPTVGIVGLGYVGLPTALGLHETGATLIGLEISEGRLDAIRRTEVDLVADDQTRLRVALGSEQFRLTSDPAALADADAVIVCVPTPVDEHQVPDLRALRSACASVVANARAGQVIILTSTSYVGCTRDLVATPLEDRGFTVGSDIHVAFSPERIDPGNVRFPQSVVPRVVGGVSAASTRRAIEVIERVAPTHAVSSPEAAEFTKILENSFRAVNIAFANEMETATRDMGLEFDEILEAASTKPFGFMPFRAGTGVGGHCIPCDPHYLLWQLKAARSSAPILEEAMTAIAARPGEIVARTSELLADRGIGLRGARVLVVGVTYNPGVDDIRESPALEILHELLERGAMVDYTDARVPELTLPDGAVLRSVVDPSAVDVDLVIIHVLHPGVDHTWLAGRPLLDPSSRAKELLARVNGWGSLSLTG